VKEVLRTIASPREPTQAELLEIAASLFVLRPVSPYPRRIQEEDWRHRSLSSYVREAVWKFFEVQGRQASLTLPWYNGLDLRVYLGDALSRAVFVEGCYEPNEFAFLTTILEPGMVVVDVGAHEGIYSSFAATLVGASGQVWAFEPSSRERTRLVDNLCRNGLSNVKVFPLALADANGAGELNVASDAYSGHNTLAKHFSESIPSIGPEAVELRKLDDLTTGLERLDLLKIDAEGAETRIIRGASRTIGAFRPVILFESQDALLRDQGSSITELVDTIVDCGYRIFSFDPQTGCPEPGWNAADQNLVAIPGETPRRHGSRAGVE
jgi:FkbM family methyltransferase